MWNGVNNVPVGKVDKCCYLGLWFQNSCSWNVHFEEVMKNEGWKAKEHVDACVEKLSSYQCWGEENCHVDLCEADSWIWGWNLGSTLISKNAPISKNGLQLIVCKLTSDQVCNTLSATNISCVLPGIAETVPANLRVPFKPTSSELNGSYIPEGKRMYSVDTSST
jgi:hypothetical protein